MGVNGIYGLSGSGLDIESLVKMGMSNKNKQYDKMEQQEIANTWLKEAYNDVYMDMTKYKYGTLSTYKMQSNMNAMQATSNNTGVVTATANGAAAAMNHTVTVDSVASNAYLLTAQNKTTGENYGITRSNADAQSSNKLADVLFKSYSINLEESAQDGNNFYFKYNVTFADGTTRTVDGSETAISVKLKDTLGSDKEYTLSYTYDELFSGMNTGEYTGFSGDQASVFNGAKTLNDFASAIAKTGANIQGGYDTANDSFSLYNKTSGKENVIDITVGNENTATLFNHLNLGTYNASTNVLSDRITFAEPTAMPTAMESVNLNNIENSAQATSIKDVLGLSATSVRNGDNYNITVKDNNGITLGTFTTDANGNPLDSGADETAFSMDLSDGTNSATVKFTLGELFDLSQIGTKSSLSGNVGLDDFAAKINAASADAGMSITASYNAIKDSFSLSNPTGQANLSANGIGEKQGVANLLIDSLHLATSPSLTYLTTNNTSNLADIFGLNTTLSKTNGGIYHLNVNSSSGVVGAVDSTSKDVIFDGSGDLFSFDISDGTNSATVTLNYSDLVNYSAMNRNGSGNIIVTQPNGSTKSVATNVTATLKNPSNNLSVLADKINAAATAAGINIKASYEDGNFSLLNTNGPVTISTPAESKVDVSGKLNLQAGDPTTMTYKTSTGITRINTTSSEDSLAAAVGLTAVKNADGSLNVKKADGTSGNVSSSDVAFSLKVGNGTSETEIAFTYADIFDTNGSGTLKGTADFSTLADKINAKTSDTGVAATYDVATGKFGLTNSAGDATLSGGDVLGSALVAKMDITETADSTAAKEAAGQAHRWAGTNASVTIDGKTYDNTTNKLTVAGVTYTFLDAAAGTKATVSVSQDTDKIVDYVKSFVEEYNTLLDSLNEKLAEKKYSDYKPLSKRQEDEMTEKQIEKWNEKAKSGLLYHNSEIQSLVSAMREAIYTKVDAVDSQYNTLSSIGITSTNTKGHLTLDTDKLKKALAEDPDCVYQLFASDQDSTYIAGSTNKNKITTAQSKLDYANTGIANRLDNIMTTHMKKISDIAGTSKETDDQSYLGKLITQMQTKMKSFKTLMSSYESKLYKRYDAMEVALSRLSAQMSFVSGSFS